MKSSEMSDEQVSHPIDIYVGARVRLRRKEIHFTQEDLADAIGITFQQVQKYERGTNRISASKLFEIARTLKVPVAYFFEGYSQNDGGEGFSESQAEQNVNGFLMTSEGIEIAEAFPRIKSAKFRRKVMELVRTLADD